MLFLNKKDIHLINPAHIQDAVALAYGLFLRNDYNMPDRMHVQDNENTLLLMPCFTGRYFGTKLVSVFPEAVNFNHPVVNGVMVLSDSSSGRPVAILDGAALTAQRTGAVGGLAVSRLTGQDLGTAGVFGAGVQGHSQARFLLRNRKPKKLFVHDLHPGAAQNMVNTLAGEFPEVEVVLPDSPEHLVAESELVIGATTSKIPLFKNDPGLVEGKTFISIGSFKPDMKEFPDAVICCADHVYIDTPFAAKESGDIFIPLEQGLVGPERIIPFAGLMETSINLQDKKGKPKTLFFKSVGMALFDIAVAARIYEQATSLSIGQNIDF